MAQSRIAELASVISTQTKIIDAELAAHGLPPLSFEPENASITYPETVLKAQQTVLETTDELHALMLSPLATLLNQTTSCNQLLSLHAISRFQVAEHFPADAAEVSFADLASATGTNESQLCRVLRHAMTVRIFRESRPGFVAHTAASKMLATPNIHDWIGLISEEMWPGAANTVDAMIKWPGSEEPAQTGFNLAHGTSLMLFDELARDPARATRFSRGMELHHASDNGHVRHLLNNYPWAALGAATVVDVGGSHGLSSLALARSFSELKCVVQDLLEALPKKKCATGEDVGDRVLYMAHDFFTEQPVRGADIYFFRWIFHDWSDEYSARILRCLIHALKPGAKVLIQDSVVPAPGTVSKFRERKYRSTDLNMLTMLNSRERSAEEWRELIKATDSRFKLSKIIEPKLSAMALIEVTWTGKAEIQSAKI